MRLRYWIPSHRSIGYVCGLVALASAAFACVGEARSATPSASPTTSAAAYSTVRVRLSPGKAGRTHVLVVAPAVSKAAKLTLISGSDCGTRGAARIGLARLVGGRSQTLVAIPFTAFKSGRFVIDIRDATNRARVEETCKSL